METESCPALEVDVLPLAGVTLSQLAPSEVAADAANCTGVLLLVFTKMI